MSEQSLRVLLVDDETSLRESLAKYLQREHGYKVETVATGEEILARIEETQGQYDVVLIDDVLMPDPEHAREPLGIKLMTEIKGRYPNIEFILFADGGMNSGLEAMRAGAYRYIRKPVDPEELAFLIEHAAEYRRLKGALRQKQILERLLETSSVMLGGRDLQDVFDTICRAAFELFDVDHSGLVLFEDTLEHGRVVAEHPDMMTRNISIPIRGVAAEEQLIASKKPLVIDDVTTYAESPGLVLDIFQRFHIRSILIVPIVFKGQVLGSFGLDAIDRLRTFTEEEIALCKIFAAQAAAALENAQLFVELRGRAERLETLRKMTLAISAHLDRGALLKIVVQQAITLLGAKSGYLDKRDLTPNVLSLRAIDPQPERPLVQLHDDEREIGPSPRHDPPSLDLVDVDRSLTPDVIGAEEHSPEAVIEAPLKWQNRIIGILRVGDDPDRIFMAEDRSLLQLFADHAAIALVNADLADRDLAKVHRLERLAQVSTEIMGNLDDLPLDQRLMLIAKYATEILDAESCGIFLVKRPGFLSLEASYGHRDGGFQKGKELTIRSGARSDLTGHIAGQGRIFNAHGRALIEHFAVKGLETSHAASSRCYSLLAIPLKKRSGQGEELIGLLRADNKKDGNGQAGPTVSFTQEDESIFKLFADAAVAAIEGAELVTQLSEQKDHLDRLIASSPNGVIAINSQGNVTAFSARAQEVLKYQPEEVLGKPVDRLYTDPREPRMVGRLLYGAPGGKLADYETFLRSKDGERIPIRLAATWLYDAQGKRIGSVGYFEDLRSIKETERRLELLLKASNIVAQAKNLTDGLQSLAEMLVALLPTTFCQIFLLDETQQFLLAKAEHPIARSGQQLEWGPELGAWIAVAEWPELAAFLVEGSPKVLRTMGEQTSPLLADWSRRLNLRQDIQSLLMIPLRARDRIVGLLNLGELRQWERAPFSKEKQDLAAAIADQTAVLMDRMRLNEITERRGQLLAALDEAARHIRAEKETSQLLQEIVRLAAELVECEVGGLYVNRPHLEELELRAIYGLPDALIGSRQPHAEGLAGLVARSGQPKIIAGYANWPEREASLDPYHLQTIVGVPLKQAGEVEAILFVADRSGAQWVLENDLEILERFAAQASIALQTSRLMNREQRMFAQLRILHQISDYIQMAGDLDTILHVVLMGVTAGYGLDFNRAALLLLDERGKHLVGRMGIGYLMEPDAYADWDRHNQRGMEDFKRYLDFLRQDGLPPTPVGEHIRRLRLPVRHMTPDVLSQAVLERRWVLVTQDELNALPEEFIMAFQPGVPLVVTPLIARDQAIGLLVADNKFTRSPITPESIDALLTFANTAAIAIDNTQLFHEIRVAQERLRSFYEASTALVSSQDPEQVLQDTVERARIAAEASGVSVILIDEMGRARSLVTAGTDKPDDITDVSRPAGLSMQVMRTGNSEIIEDTIIQRDRVNPYMFCHNIAAALCLPISLEGKRIGVMWFHYNQPRYFSKSEIEAIQLYVNQAAVAYDNARRIEELSRARNVARVVAEVTVLEDLQSTLNSVVDGTQDALSCDAVTLYVYDQYKDNLIHPPVMTGVRYPVRAVHLSSVSGDSIVFEMLKRDHMHIADDISIDPLFKDRGFPKDEQIASCVAIPLKVGSERVGVMFVNYRSLHRFTGDDLTNIELFANQAAVAIRNAQLYERVQKRASALQALYEAGHAVTGSLDLDEILQRIARQAWHLTGYRGNHIGFASIMLVDKLKARLVAAYPSEELSKRPAALEEEIDLRAGGNGWIGIMGLAITTGEPRLVGDIVNEPDYVAANLETRSELAVPIKIGSKVIGVINVEHPDYNAFDKEDQQALESLASQAAIAIQNAHLYEEARNRLAELERTKEILAARTAVAWMGMVSSTWQHAIGGHALTIGEEVDALRAMLSDQALTVNTEAKLSKIGRLARMILEKPITPPLSSEEGVISVPVNALFRERLRQLQQNEPYRSVRCRFMEGLDDSVTVRISPEWLRRVFDILIDNAIESMDRFSVREITVTTGLSDKWVTILIADTGRGIPDDVRARLFQAPIPKSKGDKGRGVGLLMAQTIIQTYEGEIRVVASSSSGTTMAIWLPLEPERLDPYG